MNRASPAALVTERPEPRRERRREVEVILNRADLLDRRERALVRAALEKGHSAAELAAIIGSDERSVRRHLARTVRRMTSPLFLFVMTRRHDWPAPRREVATAVYLHGLAMRSAARVLGMPIHQVRKHVDAIRALFDAAMTIR
jgi:DNA-directed RNA polymerase specialized sigma24 family protein